MTSANVTEYRIRKIGTREEVGHIYQHAYCKSRAHEGLSFEPAHEFEIQAYWDDEEEESHEGPWKNLRTWLVGMRELPNSIAVAAFEEHRNCDVDRFNRAIERAEAFVELGAYDVIVWYDEYDDFVKIRFHFNGHKYEVHTYKIHSVMKDGCDDFIYEKNFNNQFTLLDFFQMGKHNHWEVPEVNLYL